MNTTTTQLIQLTPEQLKSHFVLQDYLRSGLLPKFELDVRMTIITEGGSAWRSGSPTGVLVYFSPYARHGRRPTRFKVMIKDGKLNLSKLILSVNEFNKLSREHDAKQQIERQQSDERSNKEGELRKSIGLQDYDDRVHYTGGTLAKVEVMIPVDQLKAFWAYVNEMQPQC